MKEKTYKRLESFFLVDDVIRNIIWSILFLVMGCFIKIGVVIVDEIIKGSIFQVWMWGFSLIVLFYILTVIMLRLEGMFFIGASILVVMMILPIQYFQPIICSIFFTIGIAGHILFSVAKEMRKNGN